MRILLPKHTYYQLCNGKEYIYVLTPTYINNSLVVRECMVNIFFSFCTNSLTLTCDNSKEETERVSLQVEGDHVDLFEGNPSECHSLEN